MVFRNGHMVGGFDPRAVSLMSQEEFMRRHSFWNNEEDLRFIYNKCREIVQSGEFDENAQDKKRSSLKKREE